MARTTFPIITCDHEDGCDQWTHDWYEALVSNWRDLMAPGWQHDPHRADVPHLCPEHATSVGEWEGDDLPTPDEALRMGWSV